MSSNNRTITVPADQETAVRALLAAFGEPTVEKAKGKKKGSKKARKTATRVATGTTIEGKTCLVAGNRKQFIADHDWARPGTSTNDLVRAVAAGAELVGNWAIGPKYAAKHGVAATPTPAATPAAPKATVFRRANGQVAPKSEWAIREVLEAQGLSRTAVDEKTAAVLAVLA